ncbi:MAG: hypothetical protein ACI82A_002397 [Candidatus Azotimanducaceae bacterium]|jgi:hypothetical protein
MVAAEQLSRADLWSLEEYSEKREDFRQSVLEHKKDRNVMLGEHIQLLFEDRQTVRYQIQEMLRIEKVFESAGIQEELDAYNPLIPNGDNWKCTMLIQYTDVEERKIKLQALVNVESLIWVKVGEGDKIFAIADEDMERSNEEKTSAVHFMRFQFDPASLQAAKSGAEITIGCDHEAYLEQLVLPTSARASLIQDFS